MVWDFPLVASCQHSKAADSEAFQILDLRIRDVQHAMEGKNIDSVITQAKLS